MCTYDVLGDLDLPRVLFLAVSVAAVDLVGAVSETSRGDRGKRRTMILGGKPALSIFSPQSRTKSAP